MNLSDKNLFLFDIDGVLLSGLIEWDIQIISGYRILAALRKASKMFALLGSGSNYSTNEAWAMLRNLGFMLNREQVWLAARVAAQHILTELGRVKCLVVGEEGLVKELKSHGHSVVKEWRKAEAVVVGLDRFISFKKLTNAIRAINNGAYFVAVNKVRWYYSPLSGPFLSPGAVVASLEFQTGKEAVVVGKPSHLHFRTVLDTFKIRPEQAVMIGDSPESDLKPAEKLGITTVLVKSTERWEKKVDDSVKPDIVVNFVDELISYL
jgi:HAD superfamily hydrolase (TIGR01450 family)